MSYYGDADFATEDVMLVHDVNMADDPTVDVTAMLHSLPVEVQTLFSKLRKTWMEKVRARVLLVRVSVARSATVVCAFWRCSMRKCPRGDRCQLLRC